MSSVAAKVMYSAVHGAPATENNMTIPFWQSVGTVLSAILFPPAPHACRKAEAGRERGGSERLVPGTGTQAHGYVTPGVSIHRDAQEKSMRNYLRGTAVFLLAAIVLLSVLILPTGAATLADGKNSVNPNLADGVPGANLRDTNDNGMQYADGTWSMRYSGNWLRSTTVVGHELAGSGTILLNGTETATDTLTVYYDCRIRFSDAKAYRSVGMVLGKYTLPGTGEEVYVSANIDPANAYLVFYFYKKVGGAADVNCEIPLGSTFKNDTDYRFSAIKSAEGVTVYINGIRLKGPYTTVTGKDGAGKTYDIDLTKLIPVAGANFLDIDATLSGLTVKYLEEGTYERVPRGEEELASARAYDADNLFALAPPTLSANRRDPNMNGLTFDGTTAAMKYTGSYLRAVSYFKSDYLTSSTLLRGDDKIATRDVDVYYKAKYRVTTMNSSRTLGLIIGTADVAGQKVYVSCNVIPAEGKIAFYFATDDPMDFTYEIGCGFTTTPGEEYLLEIVRTGGRLHVYINGRETVELERYTVSAYGNDAVTADISVADLTPAFGVNFMDIDAAMWDFGMKYLTEYDAVDYFVEPDQPRDDRTYEYHTDPVLTTVGDVTPPGGSYALPVCLTVGGAVSAVAALTVAAVSIIRTIRRKKHEK